jgi:hypothetical protein
MVLVGAVTDHAVNPNASAPGLAAVLVVALLPQAAARASIVAMESVRRSWL